MLSGPPPGALLTAELDAFTAVYDRRSGQTHLLVEPAPQLLAMLSEGPLSLADLRTRLVSTFELPDDSAPALQARLDELVVSGLLAQG